ncbi:MAG: ATP-dependent zinc metalloprotease FtsH [Patescibacteria group bacterium]
MNLSSPNQDPKNRFNLLTVIFIIILILLFSFIGGNVRNIVQPKKEFTNLLSDIRDGKVAIIELTESQDQFKVSLYKDKEKNGCDISSPDKINVERYSTAGIGSGLVDPLTSIQTLVKDDKVKFGSKDCDIQYKKENASPISSFANSNLFSTLLFLGVTLLIGIFLIRRLGEVNNRSISFGNSKAKMFEGDEEKKVTFSDVAGNKEAKEELYQVVDFLKRPSAYLEMGAKIPKGVLLVGSPGNGKTLLAKAVAGEANVPFLFVSGSEFVEMFVGVGASRVRDLFKTARKKAPCVIFIDEIDAVGRQRGNGLGNSNDEREQTLNQILVEMDGFEKTESIIILAATNRPDVLDPALLRPGRFDRQVTVTAPDRAEREQILKVHSENKRIAEDVDLSIIARRTPGFSGADLANLMNEAAIMAVSQNKTEIDNESLRESIEKTMLGPSLKSKIQTEDMRKLTAYHEAGHALLATILPYANKVQKITIVPRGRAGGYTFNVPDNDNIITRKSQLMDEMKVLFGGYTVEEIYFKDLSTGASNDLEKATQIARDMVTKYGMGKMGPISFSEVSSLGYLGRDSDAKIHSEEFSKQVDQEVLSLMNSAHLEARELITKYFNKIELIANALLDKETLELEEFNSLVSDILTKKD